jgi:hypothetical protein
MRIFLAALIGAIAMFIWTSLAHVALPLGEAGLHEIPNESAVLATLTSQLGNQPGMYIYPGPGLGPNPTHAEKEAAMKQMGDKLAHHPSGVLVYYPTGSRPLDMTRYLLVEFATEFLEALLVVFLLSCTRLTTYGARVGFVFAAGILAAIATNVSYWNWYGFPAAYTASYIVVQVVGFLCVGLIAAWILKPHAAAPIM